MTDPTLDDIVERTLAGLSPAEKVGQMFMLAFPGRDIGAVSTLLREHGVGACYISQDNAATPEEALALSATLQDLASESAGGLPLVLGADQEGAWGVLVPHSTTGPGNLALGAAGDPGLTRDMYAVIGREMRAVGYNAVLAPCADVNTNPANPSIGVRSFGEDPAAVAAHVAAAVAGVRSAGAVVTAKHFPGHGDTSGDSHRLLPTVDQPLDALEATHLRPFRAAVEAGVDIVMTSHILYPQIDPQDPATLSRTLLDDLLRRRMGFAGIVLSDSMNMWSMRRNYAPDDAAVRAVLAGVDMIMLAEEHYEHDLGDYLDKQLLTLDGVLRAVRDGLIPAERVDQAVRRILRLKLGHPAFTTPPPPLAELGSPANRAVADRGAAAAVAVLRDRGGLWPLADRPLVLVGATPEEAYAVLGRTRGIGPNQTEPAFAVFRDEIVRARPSTRLVAAEAVLAAADPRPLLGQDALVLAVTEDYLLPGLDFAPGASRAVVARLAAAAAARLVVVGLRSPYELAAYDGVGTYACAFSSRPGAARAAARAALGEVPALGRSPVTAA